MWWKIVIFVRVVFFFSNFRGTFRFDFFEFEFFFNIVIVVNGMEDVDWL